MAEESKQIDPDATVSQPMPALDPGATVAQPIAALDPDATVSQPMTALDPEATATRAVFDPDATVNPAERLNLDPDITARMPTPGKARDNPFAPKSRPETLHANLSSLGGLNPLVAMANPILGAVPQIRRTLKHPDPATLRASLRDQLESLQTSAMSAEIPDATAEAAVYALCALLDESAASTPWGLSWAENGLLKELRGESGGGEGFFALLERTSAEQSPESDDKADLLELLYICLALGFEGRYRNAEGGRQALEQIAGGLYEVISRRRPRPLDGLSARWRSATAEAAAAPALEMAAQVAAQISAKAAAQAHAAESAAAARVSLLSRVPRRAVWSALGAFVGAVIVLYLLALRLLEDETTAALASRPVAKAKATQAAAPAPGITTAPATEPVVATSPAAAPGATTAPATAAGAAPVSGDASAILAKALEGEPVAITEDAGRVTIALRSERQFASGSTLPAARLRPLIRKIAAALDRTAGPIVVTGHADASPTRSGRFASNAELSAARAQSVAQLMAPALADPMRLSVEGRGETEPLAPGDTAADRARNRRATITLNPGAKPAS
jgi:type VI secretion system protein ImpK